MVDRRFWVADGRRGEFANVFRPDGVWGGLLRRSQGYIATEVKCESSSESRYRVRDFWSWHRDYEVFREQYSEDLAEFERQIVDRLIARQEFVGGYYEPNEPDFGIT